MIRSGCRHLVERSPSIDPDDAGGGGRLPLIQMMQGGKWCRWREVLPLIRRMIWSGCRETMQGGEVVAMAGSAAADRLDDSERVPSSGGGRRLLIRETMQAVAVAVCCCCVPCLAVMVDGLPLIRRMIRSGCRHLVERSA